LDVFCPEAVDELKGDYTLRGNIDKKVLASNTDRKTLARLMDYDERRLYQRMFAYTEFGFEFDEQHHIILNSESWVYFHTFIWKLLSSIVANLELLKAYTDPIKNKAKGYERVEEEARGLLTTIDRNFLHLTDLVNRSPTFHIYMRNPAILRWLVEQGRIIKPFIQISNLVLCI